jgi:hypothetical protein
MFKDNPLNIINTPFNSTEIYQHVLSTKYWARSTYLEINKSQVFYHALFLCPQYQFLNGSGLKLFLFLNINHKQVTDTINLISKSNKNILPLELGNTKL